MKKILFILFSISFFVINAQEEDKNEVKFKSVRPKVKKRDSILTSSENYKIISIYRDTTYIDTTLNVKNFYKHNHLGKDMFEYMGFSNEGQTYAELGKNFRNISIHPDMGATANKYFRKSVEDVYYYYVPTPITRFLYKSTIEEGQILNSMFSANISKQVNIFVQYDALKSLGKYRNIKNKNGTFVVGGAYISKNKKYWLFGHYANESIEKQENGGLLNQEQFTDGQDQFKNRAAIDVNLEDANTNWSRKRYFFTQHYNLLREGAEVNSKILIKHLFSYETTKYKYDQARENKYFGDSYILEGIGGENRLKTMTNKLGAELVLPYMGRTFVYGKAFNYRYLLKNVFYTKDGKRYPSSITGTDYGIGVEWNTKYKGFWINTKAEQMMVGNLLGTELDGKIGCNLSNIELVSGIKINSVSSNFNKVLYFSDYKKYNWSYALNKENYQTLYAQANTKWADASVDLSNINNYTIFKLQPDGQSTVEQIGGNIQYLKIKASKDFKFWKFGLDNTLMYQEVIQEGNYLNLPKFTTRNTIYFSSNLFDKAMFLQTGISVKYYTKYYADRYNPLLNEMEVQTIKKIGDYPYFDFFINAKVQTMRIFLNLENGGGYFIKNRYFVAPNQPFRDPTIRIGLIWNFFS